MFSFLNQRVKLPHVSQPFRVKMKVTHDVYMYVYIYVSVFRLSVKVSAQVTMNTAIKTRQKQPKYQRLSR
jgi:hypothetical protein